MQDRRARRGMVSSMVWVLAVWAVVAYQAGIAAQVTGPARSSEQLQIEKGRVAVGQTCATCHTNILRIIQIHRKSAQEWRNTVYSMIGRGAQIFPEEIEPITAFLAANAGPKPSQTSGAAQSAPVSQASQLPDGEGRAILQRGCQRCHDLATATRKPPSEDWKTVIGRMVTQGAEVSPADQQKLIDYLNGLTK